VSSPRAAASPRRSGAAEAAEPLLQLGRFRASSLTTDRTRATLPRALEIKRAAETPRRFTIVLGSEGGDAAPEGAQLQQVSPLPSLGELAAALR
jgi:hypothetical protein